MMTERISKRFSFPSKYIEVEGAKIHYVESGTGTPILFLHGVPTSSYVWRNIIPHLSNLGRCIAPDLIGFGKSDKPNIQYTVFDHIKYIEKFIAALNLKKIILVMHGWGSVIGFHYAMEHEKNCAGLAFYEAFLRSANGSDISLPLQEQLNFLTDLENSADASIGGTFFVDKIIPQDSMRHLSSEEMEYYREPFKKMGTDKPILQYLKDLPKGDGSSKVDELIANYTKKLTKSSLPKLMLYSVPGLITTVATLMWAKEHLPNLEIVDIGEELHMGQESYPQLIGESISIWLQSIEQGGRR